MKKFFAILTALCLLCTAVLALADEAAAPALRSGVTFGMTPEQVLAAEPSARYEFDRENTRGGVNFVELEYEDVTEDGVPADLTYLFVNNALVAIRLSYDTEDYGVSYDRIQAGLTNAYGASAPLDMAALGLGIYAVDDDGIPEGTVEVWTAEGMMIILERDRDDIDVTYVDLTAAYLAA